MREHDLIDEISKVRMSSNVPFGELKMLHQELANAKRELEHKMAQDVMDFDGTLVEAIKMGMVKFNFPAPAGLISHLHKK